MTLCFTLSTLGHSTERLTSSLSSVESFAPLLCNYVGKQGRHGTEERRMDSRHDQGELLKIYCLVLAGFEFKSVPPPTTRYFSGAQERHQGRLALSTADERNIRSG